MTDFYDDNEDVVNSSLYESNDSIEEDYDNLIFNDSSLKVGIVLKCYEIDDKKNKNKRIPEYDVLIVEQKKKLSMEPVIYKNCISADGFGGKSDFFEYKLRPVPKKETTKKTPLDTDFKDQFGSMVLLLCLDGIRDKGIILKSISHKGRKTNLTKENGVHLEGQYNGINIQVNKDGELTLTFKSKTDEEGKPQDEKAGGTHFKMDKTGSVDINTNLEGDEETYIKMNKTKKGIGLKAGENIELEAKKDIKQTAEGNITLTSTGDIISEAEGSAKYTSQSTLDIEGVSGVTIKGKKVTIEAESNLRVKASNIIISAPNIKIGDAAVPALVPTTQFLGISPFLGLPVLSTAIGPFSSTVLIST